MYHVCRQRLFPLSNTVINLALRFNYDNCCRNYDISEFKNPCIGRSISQNGYLDKGKGSLSIFVNDSTKPRHRILLHNRNRFSISVGSNIVVFYNNISSNKLNIHRHC